MFAFGTSTGGGRRSDKREAAPLAALLTTRSKVHKGVLIDISATGARIRSGDLPSCDDEGYLQVEGVKTFASVRWRNEHECGVQFDEPLTQAEVIGLRREVLSAAGLTTEMKAALDDWVLGIAR
jgi:hypothetical protein